MTDSCLKISQLWLSRASRPAHQLLDGLGVLSGQNSPVGHGLDARGVLLRNQSQGLLLVPLGQVHPPQQTADKAHVGQVQHIVLRQNFKGLGRQGDDLRLGVGVDLAHRLHPHLEDLLKGAPHLSVDVLVVVDLLAVPAVVLDDGQGDVRLQGLQGAVHVGEGDDVALFQKVFVLGVQVVVLKLGHAEFPIAVALVQLVELFF